MGQVDLPSALISFHRASPSSRMLAIHAVLPCLLAAAVLSGDALGLSTQTPPAGASENTRASDGLAALYVHRANLRAEREDDFFRAWEAATPAARQRTAQVLRDLRSQGAPAEWRPDIGSLGVATWTLGGGDPELLLGENPAASLAVQAVCVDLVVRPGAFVATEAGGRPANLTVRVWPLFELRETLDVTVRLIWIAPDGSESLAREEPVAARAFSDGGFDLFVRAPKSTPGVWRLVLELEPDLGALKDGLRSAPVGLGLLGAARSAPVLVPCVASLPAETAEEQGFHAGTRAVLVQSGLRLSFDAERLAREKLVDVMAPEPTRPADDFATSVLLASPRDLAGGPTLAGIVGETWRQAVPARLLPVEPSAGGVEDRIHQTLATLPPGARVLVLRGDTVLDAQLESLRFGLFEVDALVVLANEWRPTATLPKVPTLFLTPNAQAAEFARTQGEGYVDAETLAYSPFLSELELPGRVASFLERHAIGRQQ